MDGCMDERMAEHTDGQTEGHMYGRMYGQTYGWTYGQTYGRTYGPTDGQMLKTWSLKQVSVQKILLWGAASVLSSVAKFNLRSYRVATLLAPWFEICKNCNRTRTS
jgi:hypothetical protein